LKLFIHDELEILAVTDSFAKIETNSSFGNISVIPIVDIQKYTYDYVVIGTVKDVALIKGKLIDEGAREDKILKLEDFYLSLYEEYYKDNDLWDFYMNHSHGDIHKLLHYFRVYDKWFSKFRNKEIVMVEIGVGNGGSLQMWKNYFGSKATIVGIDLRTECKRFEEEQIHIEIGSQEDIGFWEYIKQKYPQIDILLDDGGHTMKQQIVTYEEMFPHIKDGGIYLCEDTHTSYIQYYGGGLKKNTSYIEYSKNFIDDLNAYYIDEKEIGYNTKNIAGLHYYDSMVVIEKERVRSESFAILRNTMK